MGYIKQLPEELVKKIAAGEVIERPASVVKELVENSIDAGATKIEIEIEIEGAGKCIKVSDNGIGIDPDDIDLLFTRYATSKIKRFDDLWSIDTLGFRGEALSSICAVSKVTTRSKHINQEYGFELKALDGKINKKTSAISIGTIFEIEDLFYNVPARQKFLKSEATELNHIYDVVVSLALSHPKISFLLKNNKNIILKSSGSKDLKLTITELLGNDLENNLISILVKNNFLDVTGYISALETYRADRKSVFVFINNRPIKCQIISKAVFSAYEGLLPPGKFPIVVLNLSFKPRFVDVNVHPAKKEVRYTHPNDVYNLVLHSLQNAISDYYKKEYKEKSVYSLPKDSPPEVPLPSTENQNKQANNITPHLSSAALEFYANTEHRISDLQVTAPSPQLFSTNNLKCQVTHSDKPIVKMTRIGNKTIFEVGSIFDENIQVVFSGEIVGDGNYQKDFFNSLADLSKEIYKTFINNDKSIQKKIISPSLESNEQKEIERKKPSDFILYQVWERDNWTCVYCGKQLLDPKLVKTSMPNAKDAFITYINKEGKEVTNHILREHMATYDHFLPVSKLPQFNFDKENLFACCLECNRKKSDSMEIKTWKPVKQNNWDKPLKIARLCFNTPKSLDKVHST